MISVCSLDELKIHRPGERAVKLAKGLDCSPVAAAVLDSRNGPSGLSENGLGSPSLEKQLDQLNLGRGCDAVGELWSRAIAGKRVLVYGDYDVDGVSATVLAVEMAQACHADSVRYYIPHRQTEGYGLHLEGVRRILAGRFDTMIVVDCGSKDVEAIEAARAGGMDVMVFDHHSVEGQVLALPSFINPQQDGDAEARGLCAAGVIWCWAWKAGILPRPMLLEMAQLAALATVSDCMPLGPLNRQLIRSGLMAIRRRPRRGLQEIFRALDLSREILDEFDLAMKVIPCLNAAGRLYVADLAVDVLAGIGDLRANVERLLSLNRRRREISSSICAAINNRLQYHDEAQVLYDDSWPVGILSAIASRLCYEHRKAFALAGPSGGGIRGTLRVPDGANAVELLSQLDGLLDEWGGHKSAAGFSVNQLRWPKVSVALNAMLSRLEVRVERQDVIAFDPCKIDRSGWLDVLKLGPFGNGNPAPSFFMPFSSSASCAPLGNRGVHLKINLGRASLLAFNGAKQISHMMDSSSLAGWIYKPRFNSWRGQVSLQFIVDKIVTR